MKKKFSSTTKLSLMHLYVMPSALGVFSFENSLLISIIVTSVFSIE